MSRGQPRYNHEVLDKHLKFDRWSYCTVSLVTNNDVMTHSNITLGQPTAHI